MKPVPKKSISVLLALMILLTIVPTTLGAGNGVASGNAAAPDEDDGDSGAPISQPASGSAPEAFVQTSGYEALFTDMELIASFDFESDPVGGYFVGDGARARVNGTPGYGVRDALEGEQENRSLVFASNFFLSEVTKADGKPLLAGLSEFVVSYDSKPAATNNGLTFYANRTTSYSNIRWESHLGILDTAAAVTAHRFHSFGTAPKYSNPVAERDSVWRHVDVVFSKESTSVYIDGELKATEPSEFPIGQVMSAAGGYIWIGRAQISSTNNNVNTSNRYYTGELDNFQIWKPIDPDDAGKVAAAKEALTMPYGVTENEVFGNIHLPKAGLYNTAVTWKTSHPGIVDTQEHPLADYDPILAGVVTRPKDVDTVVTMTATISCGEAADTKEFSFTVKKAPEKSKDELETDAYVAPFFAGAKLWANGVPPTVPFDERDEQIYFALSTDAMKWTDTRPFHQPVLRSTVGDLGVRDPYIIRSPEGDKFYLIATDLSCWRRGDWAGFNSSNTSTKLVVWDSTDLVSWSEPRAVEVAGPILGARKLWAPEVIYDDKTGDYFVTFTATTDENVDTGGTSRTSDMIWYSRTRDFITFEKPVLWYNPSSSVIDATVLKGEDGFYYRALAQGNIRLGKTPIATGLTGVWEETGQLQNIFGGTTVWNQLYGSGVEGPELFTYNKKDWPIDAQSGEPVPLYAIYVDRSGQGTGYMPFTTTDIGAATRPPWEARPDIDLGLIRKRHGGFLQITMEEHDRIMEAYAGYQAWYDESLTEGLELIADFSFEGLPESGSADIPADGNLDAKAIVKSSAGGAGTISRSENTMDGSDYSYSLSENGWLELVKKDGSPLLAERENIVVSFDSKYSAGNWAFFAARDASPNTATAGHYVGLENATYRMPSGIKPLLIAKRFNVPPNTGIPYNSPTSIHDQDENGWEHIDVVIRPDSTALYINGELRSSVETEGDSYKLSEILGPEGGVLQLGKGNIGAAGQFYTGLIDNFKIYADPVAASPVKDYIGATAAGRAPILPRRVVVEGLRFDNPTASLIGPAPKRFDFGETFENSLIPVIWDMSSFSASDYAIDKAGTTFTVTGVTAPDSRAPGYRAKAVFTVNAPAVIDFNHSITSENVIFDDIFWAPKQMVNATVTFDHAVSMLESTSTSRYAVQNFKNAKARLEAIWAGQTVPSATFRGYVFQDSDVHKTLEGFAYTLATVWDDPAVTTERKQYLLAKVKEWGELIEAVQYADGYLDTMFTMRNGSHRWRTFGSHEMYVMGHFLEAAVAYTRFSIGAGLGDYTLYEVGRRVSDHIVEYFGPNGKRVEVPGHEEIELALMKFAALCEEYEGADAGQKYRDTVELLVDRRGRMTGDNTRESGYSGGEYSQDATPLVDETKAVGHAVRAMYFYTGATDVANSMPDSNPNKTAFLTGINNIFNTVFEKNMYITGGLGSGETSEGFGDDYRIKSAEAYTENCAAIAGANWYQRLNLYHEKAEYADAYERTLYNGVLVGVSLNGNRFYYGCYLDTGSNARSEWFSCACCPPNLIRTIANIGGYMYTVNKDKVFTNLYGGSKGNVNVQGTNVAIRQETDYPWDGAVKITVTPEAAIDFTLNLRIPGWVYAQKYSQVVILVDGKPIAAAPGANGYVSITRSWPAAGTVIEMDIPIEVRYTEGDDNVSKAYGDFSDGPNSYGQSNKVVIERGPVVYQLETAGVPATATTGRDARYVYIPRDMEFTETWRPDLLRGIVEITGMARYNTVWGVREQPIQLTPYYAKNNRGNDPSNLGSSATNPNNSSSAKVWINATEFGVQIRGDKYVLPSIGDLASLTANPKVNYNDRNLPSSFEWSVLKGSDVVEIAGAPVLGQTDDSGSGKIGGVGFTRLTSTATYKALKPGVATVQVVMKDASGKVMAVDTYDITVTWKGALLTAINAFAALSASDFTSDSYAAAKAVYDAAVLLGNDSAASESVTAINAMTANLLEAVGGMVTTISYKTALQAAISEAQARKTAQETWESAPSGYAPWSPNGYARMLALLAGANGVYGDTTATVSVVDGATALLKDGLDAMRAGNMSEIEDIPALREVVVEALAIKANYFTEESYAVLSRAIGNAEDAMRGVHTGSCTRVAFDSAISQLKAGIDSLAPEEVKLINLWEFVDYSIFVGPASGSSTNNCIIGWDGAYEVGGDIRTYGLWNSYECVWRIVPDQNHEYFQLRRQVSPAAQPGNSFAPTGGVVAAGTRLTLVEPSDTDDSQWWKLVLKPNGRFVILNKANPALCLATRNNSTGSGAMIDLVPVANSTVDWRFGPSFGVSSVLPVQKAIVEVTAPEDVTVTVGTAIGDIPLPSKVSVRYAGNSRALRDVAWDTSAYNGAGEGAYTLTGTIALDGIEVNPDNVKASITIIVEVEEFTVSFVAWDGTALGTQTVKAGEFATAPVNPAAREGYHFLGWFTGDKVIWVFDTDAVTEDLTLSATYALHVENVATTPATCTTPGLRVAVCDICGIELWRESIPANGHTPGAQVVTTAATCTEKGAWEVRCTVCGAIVETGETAALGHDWDAGKTTKPPTYDSEGVLTYTCRRCGETYTKSIPKLFKPDWVVVGEWAARIRSGGLSNSQLTLVGKVLTLVLDGRSIVLSTSANNKNISGTVALGDGYYLNFDIKGNGSNIKVFDVTMR